MNSALAHKRQTLATCCPTKLLRIKQAEERINVNMPLSSHLLSFSKDLKKRISEEGTLVKLLPRKEYVPLIWSD